MYQIPDIVLVGYGRQQVYQNKCLKCGNLFFESAGADEDSRELFCDECSNKYSVEYLNKYRAEFNFAETPYIGNVVGWIVKMDATTKRSRYNYNKVYKRDRYTCQYCGYSPTKHNEFLPLHIDHVFPFVHGGSNKMDNLVVACQECNLLVSSKIFSSFEGKRKFILKEKIKRGLFYDEKYIRIQGLEELII